MDDCSWLEFLCFGIPSLYGLPKPGHFPKVVQDLFIWADINWVGLNWGIVKGVFFIYIWLLLYAALPRRLRLALKSYTYINNNFSSFFSLLPEKRHLIKVSCSSFQFLCICSVCLHRLIVEMNFCFGSSQVCFRGKDVGSSKQSLCSCKFPSP